MNPAQPGHNQGRAVRLACPANQRLTHTASRCAVALISLILCHGAAFGAPGPPNDRFANSSPINGTNAIGSNVGAGKETGEPDHAGNPGGESVWWTWSTPTNGEVTITTDGSSFDTLLGVYTGSTVSNLNQVAASDDHGVQVTSRVRFEATQGLQYKIAVDGYSDGTNVDSGSITLTLAFIPEPIPRPPNDNFTNRIFLDGASLTATGSNVEATREPGEPIHAGKTSDTSVWWSWTAPAAGGVRLSTEGSEFDTLLAVYKGSSVTNLIEVASNDDQDPIAGTLTSIVIFQAAAGDTYQIAVDGFDGDAGRIALKIDTVITTLSAPTRLADGTCRFTLDGLAGGTYAVEATAEFTGWTNIATLVNTNGALIFDDRTATNFSRRFYRAALKP